MTPGDFELHTTPPDEDFALSNTYSIFILSNGERIYGKDNPQSTEVSTWILLQNYLNATNLRIHKIVLKFRSNEVHYNFPDDTDCIYFSKGVGKDWTAAVPDYFLIVGHRVTPARIECEWRKVPELTLFKTESKEIEDIPLDKQFLYFYKS